MYIHELNCTYQQVREIQKALLEEVEEKNAAPWQVVNLLTNKVWE